MRIAIFGGSFDPIHKGHLEIIEKLSDDFHMDKIIVIPTNVSYYKKSKSMFTYDKKLELCKLAINKSEKLHNKNIEVSDIERTIGEDEGFAHTILRLKDIYPNDELFTVIGSDSYNYINTWRSYQLIYENSKLIVAKRPENQIDDSIGIEYLVLEMNNDNSSTEIRKKIIDLILE
jgi:nicotinate-nucleotide adenylyltransferase